MGQVDAMTLASTREHGGNVEGSQGRGGLPGMKHPAARICDHVHEGAGGIGNTRSPLKEIQERTLGS
jgi:hypothetical protein